MAVNLRDVVQVNGERGVYKIVKTLRNGLLLESIDEEKRRLMKSTRAMTVFSLESTVICTTSDVEGLPVADFFNQLHEKYADELPIDCNAEKEVLADFMRSEVEDYDETKLQPNKVAKLIQWYCAVRKHLPDIWESKEKKDTKKK